jgi:hypothetical protein
MKIFQIIYIRVPHGCGVAYGATFAQYTGLLDNEVTYRNSTSGPQCFDACGITSSINFKNWVLSIITNSPVVLPYNDDEIRTVLALATAGGCNVRIVGAGHTEDGFVQQVSETNVVVINLANYIPPPEWNGVIDERSGKLRINAGTSWMEVLSIARPRGFIMETQTAGFFFSVGGVVSNPSVHGATFSKGRLNNMVTALRVMLANGTSLEVTAPDELSLWRGSLGYLGIITAVELQMRVDEGLLMSYKEDVYSTSHPWNSKNFVSDINDTVLNFDGCEWFYNPWQDKVQHLRFKFKGDSSFNYGETAPLYSSLQSTYPNNALSRTGGLATADSILGSLTFAFMHRFALKLAQFLSESSMSFATDYTKRQWLMNNSTRRDMYYVGSVMRFNQLYASIQCINDCVNDKTLFTMIDATRTFLRNICATPELEWYPT